MCVCVSVLLKEKLCLDTVDEPSDSTHAVFVIHSGITGELPGRKHETRRPNDVVRTIRGIVAHRHETQLRIRPV